MNTLAQKDFEEFMRSLNIDHAMLDEARKKAPRGTPVPSGLKVGESPIEGEGLFATSTFEKGTRIARLLDHHGWTEAGMKMNHNPDFNAKRSGEWLIASEGINPGEEIVADYRQIGGLAS